MYHPANTYQYLVDEFTEGKIKTRFEFIEFQCYDILDRFNSTDLKLKEYFHVNRIVVQDIVVNYFADIDRLKKFHGINKVNSIKIASYTGYWVSKLKPVQLYNNNHNFDFINHRKLVAQINEKIALALIIGIAFDQNKEKYEPTAALTEFYKYLIYFLTYRISSPQMIELALQAHIANPEYPISIAED
ncbi:MAG: hypothetical protein OEV44_15035 [Spirochaetota bacterium]|nr:hypothetical protein [Spirochaetota bacterium]